MAKFSKQKPAELKDQRITEPDCTSCAVVRHEKLCLQVDVRNQRLHGFAELKVVAPTKRVVGLHAQGLNIERVLYDGVPTEYEIIQGNPFEGEENSPCAGNEVPMCVSDAADSALVKYVEALEKELVPGLLICVPEPSIPAQNKLGNMPTEKGEMIEMNGNEDALEALKEEVAGAREEQLKLLRVDYWLEKPESGACFSGNMFHTTNQPHRARCWFPCVDADFQMCSYEMEFTVDSEYVAVSCGKPLYQVLSKDEGHRKTYVYKLDIPVAARLVSLIVAPLEVHPDRQNISISHFCLPGSLLQLQCTITFFHSVFSYYEDYLGASFPFGSYNHVFVDSGSLMQSASVGAAATVLSSHLLVDEKVIDQTISTRIKIAHSLAQQWFGVFISPETPNDAWLLEGLCMFLTDLFVKRHFGNNETYYRRFKANEAVCRVDVDGAPPLCHHMDLHGTERLGLLGHVQSWKAAAVVQMLEKQMGPEAFRKILQRIILRAQDPVRKLRTLSTKEFRHFANKLGNLERPFLKEFFRRWVESPGCPVLRMGFVYSKRRNMIELAVHRGCTATPDKTAPRGGDTTSDKPVLADVGWPGMMSIRIHELDGMYDHPSLPMAGEAYQLLEIQCHSKLAGRRIPRPKKGNKPEGPEEVEATAALADTRQNIDSPLLWIRADPQMEYLADIQLQQPEQMWINQLEKDRNVTAQLQAIAALCTLPQMSFSAVNALNNCLADSKIFYRVRIEAALALASTATEATGWAGLSHLIKLYKSRRYDVEVGLPRPNDFHDFAEYFVLEVIPGAVATVRGSDGKSPPEAVEFIFQLLKYNDNSGNQFLDVFWLASVIRSIGKLEFSQQSLENLHRMLKRIDRFLQYDRIMPSYNNLVTISCIHTLTELALKFSDLLPMAQIEKILLPFKDTLTVHWKVRAEALKAVIELETHLNGLDAGVQLALHLINSDPSTRVQIKLLAHILHLSILKEKSKDSIQGLTLSHLLLLLQSRRCFLNIRVRHHVFSLVQVFAGRLATLFRSKVSHAASPTNVEPVAVVDTLAASDLRNRPGSFKVRLQQPQEVPVEPVEPVRTEPVRLRIVTTAPLQPKEILPAVSVTSSGKQESERKVGVVKLRLKPAMSTQNTAALSKDKAPAPLPVRSSSMSVDFGLRLNDSPHSIKHGGFDGAFAKEESDGVKEPSSSNDVSVGKNGGLKGPPKIKVRHSKGFVINSICKSQSENLDTVINRTTMADAGVSSSEPDAQPDVAESHGEQQSGQGDMVMHLRLKQEEESSSHIGLGRVEEGVRRHKKKKRTEEERKERDKKRHRERDDEHRHDGEHQERRRDKHSDPEYLERKRLKKEKRREEQQRQMQNLEGDGGASLQTAKADLHFSSEKHVTGTSETVIRLKIKRKVQVDD